MLPDAVSVIDEFGNLRSRKSTFNRPRNSDVMYNSHVVSYHSARALAVQSSKAAMKQRCFYPEFLPVLSGNAGVSVR